MDTLPLVAPEQVGLSAQRLARISGWMKGWVDSGKLPGLLVAVMRRGELAFAETYGKADVERNKPVRPDTIYRIYSMTKAVTTVAAMMLHEEGAFELKDPVHRWIPSFRDSNVRSVAPRASSSAALIRRTPLSSSGESGSPRQPHSTVRSLGTGEKHTPWSTPWICRPPP